MIKADKRRALFLMHQEGMGVNELARRFHISRKTVRAIIRQQGEMPVLTRRDKIAIDRELLDRLFQECDGSVQRVHEKLVEEPGVRISYSTLKRIIRDLGIRKTANHANPVLSVNAAQRWLSELLRNTRELDLLRTQLGADISSLLSYLKHGRARHRKKAATILARTRGIPNRITAKALNSSVKTTRRYYRFYRERGVHALFAWNTTRKYHSDAQDTINTNRILELLHNKPTFFGINRTNWTQPALLAAYSSSFNETIGRRSLIRLLQQTGYRWRKARRVLTSPDPRYHEKVELLLATLHSLASDEMFFFLDEWGPVQVKKRGGRAYRGRNFDTEIPRHQASRGTVSLVSALSATTNRMTWHFVNTKDSVAMFDLLEILFNQYHGVRRLYVTWDAVAFHNCASLLDALDQFNEVSLHSSCGPAIELVPLPISAQFLNIVEGVLSGMTKAVVDNSDYPSTGEMKQAISRHFVERNEYFHNNPRRCGKKIWELDFFRDVETIRAGDCREW